MLKFRHKQLFILTASALLLMCMALNLKAQDAPLGGTARGPHPTTTPTPQSTPSNGGRTVGKPVIGGLNQRAKNRLAEGIYGVIRWKKEYGLPSTDGGATPNKSLNCTAFRVDTSVQEGAPGTFGKANPVGYWTIQNEPTEENGYYICRYSTTNRNPLPHNRVITVSPYLGPFASAELNQALITGGWFGSGQPRPPAGYQRVLIGGRGISLTDNEPRVTVDFEMVYRPIPAPPR
jgi:hypothetical protein